MKSNPIPPGVTKYRIKPAMPHKRGSGFINGMDSYYVYGLYNPISGRIFYIGVSTDLHYRVAGHVSCVDSTRPIIKEINDAGHLVVCVILFETKGRAEAYDVANRLVKKHQSRLVNNIRESNFAKYRIRPPMGRGRHKDHYGYGLYNPITHRIFYLGKTKDPHRR
ncbi:MAG: hypothetical protein ABIG63_17740, partial [Chloroflexota bacterium]